MHSLYATVYILQRSNEIDTNGTGAAAFHMAEHYRRVFGNTGRTGPPREAGLQSASGVPADGSCRVAQLHILVPRGTHDKLRQRARR